MDLVNIKFMYQVLVYHGVFFFFFCLYSESLSQTESHGTLTQIEMTHSKGSWIWLLTRPLWSGLSLHGYWDVASSFVCVSWKHFCTVSICSWCVCMWSNWWRCFVFCLLACYSVLSFQGHQYIFTADNNPILHKEQKLFLCFHLVSDWSCSNAYTDPSVTRYRITAFDRTKKAELKSVIHHDCHSLWNIQVNSLFLIKCSM